MLPFVIERAAMKKHLTDASVQRIKPPMQGSLEIFDLGYPGLALRIGHGGTKSFEIFYRVGGKLRRDTLGRWPEVSLAKARELWRTTREAIAKGQEPRRDNGNASPRLFESVVEDWMKRDLAPNNKQSSLYLVERMVERDMLPAWRGRAIESITKQDVIGLLDGIVDRGAKISANRTYAALGRLFKWATGRDIVSKNPMMGLGRPGGKEESRERVLDDEELVKVWGGAGKVPVFGDVVKLLLLTGARKEEIGQLKWDEIEEDHIVLSNGRTKTGNGHIIPLSPMARSVLDAMPRIGEYVFTVNGVKPIAGWSVAKENLDKASGVSDWRIHDIRRTCATGLQKLGVTLQAVEAVLGHTSGSRGGIVGVYQRHDYADEKRAALKAWATHLSALLEGRKPGKHLFYAHTRIK